MCIKEWATPTNRETILTKSQASIYRVTGVTCTRTWCHVHYNKGPINFVWLPSKSIYFDMDFRCQPTIVLKKQQTWKTLIRCTLRSVILFTKYNLKISRLHTPSHSRPFVSNAKQQSHNRSVKQPFCVWHKKKQQTSFGRQSPPPHLERVRNPHAESTESKACPMFTAFDWITDWQLVYARLGNMSLSRIAELGK